MVWLIRIESYSLVNLTLNHLVAPNWHEGGYFYFFLEVKININRVNLKPCQAHRVL